MPKPEQDHASPGYQANDIEARKLVWIAAIVFGCLVFVGVVAYWLTGWYGQSTHGATRGATPVSVAAPEPHLQANPQPDLLKHRAAKRALLTGYGWVDRNKETVRIPIDRAMELTVQRAGAQGGGS